MKISANIAVILSIVFALLCSGVAVTGFSSLGEMTDPAQIADAKGYAWFWAFLATVAIVFGALSWWIARTQGEGEEND